MTAILIPLTPVRTTPRPALAPLDLSNFDLVIVNTSGGKDSQCLVRHVAAQAKICNFEGRIRAVHADLLDVEWEGVPELAEEQARAAGLPFEIVMARKGEMDLLDYMIRRGQFPSSQQRYCTSDYKRGPVTKVITREVSRLREDYGWGKSSRSNPRRIQVLNVMGMRAQESPARAKKSIFEWNERASNGLRDVYTWLPIHHWTLEEVWDDIRESGIRYHWCYDRGMGRLSCCFCIFAPFASLVLAGVLNERLLWRYVRAEADMKNADGTSHTFRKDCSLAMVQEAVTKVVAALYSENRAPHSAHMKDVRRVLGIEGQEISWNM